MHVQVINALANMFKSWWLVNINLFLKDTIEEGIINI